MASTRPPEYDLLFAIDELTREKDVPFSRGQIHAPKYVRTEVGELLFKCGPEYFHSPSGELSSVIFGPSYPHGAAPVNLWKKFIDLQDAPLTNFHKFAKRFGGLWMCPHGMPFGHVPDCNHPSPSPRDLTQEWHEQHHPRSTKAKYTVVHKTRIRITAEPVERWRVWARAFDGMIHLAAALAQNFVGDMKDWNAVHAAIAPDFPGGQTPSEHFAELRSMTADWPLRKRNGLLLEVGRLLFQTKVSRIVELARIGPRLEWDYARSGFRVSLDTSNSKPNLFSMIVIQILPCLAGPIGPHVTATCSVCGNQYLASRVPNVNRRNYCSVCQGETNRLSKRDRRARAKAAKGATVGDFVGTPEEKSGKNRQKPPQ